MKTKVTLTIDTEKATCAIIEEGAEEGTYPIISDSDESIAESIGKALSLYLQGFEPDTSDQKGAKGYKLFYEPRYGYGMKFDPDVQEQLYKVIKASEDNECDWEDMQYNIREKIGCGVIDEFAADIVSFERWFGNDDFYGYQEGDEYRFPASVQNAAETIFNEVKAFISSHKEGEE